MPGDANLLATASGVRRLEVGADRGVFEGLTGDGDLRRGELLGRDDQDEVVLAGDALGPLQTGRLGEPHQHVDALAGLAGRGRDHAGEGELEDRLGGIGGAVGGDEGTLVGGEVGEGGAGGGGDVERGHFGLLVSLGWWPLVAG